MGCGRGAGSVAPPGDEARLPYLQWRRWVGVRRSGGSGSCLKVGGDLRTRTDGDVRTERTLVRRPDGAAWSLRGSFPLGGVLTPGIACLVRRKGSSSRNVVERRSG